MKEGDIRKLATLCRIDLTDEEVTKLRGDMENILGYVSEIGEVITETGVPTVEQGHNIMREEGEPHASGMYTEDMLASAPKSEERYVQVKAIL